MRGYTVEMSFLMPVVLLLIMSSIYAFFYYHDKNIICGAAYETAVVAGNKARETVEGGAKQGVDEDEIKTLFWNRVNGKCILLSEIESQIHIGEDEVCVEVQASWKKMKLRIEKRAAITEPEKKIRDMKKIKGIVNGTKNYN